MRVHRTFRRSRIRSSCPGPIRRSTTAGEEVAAGLERLSGRRPRVVTQAADGRSIGTRDLASALRGGNAGDATAPARARGTSGLPSTLAESLLVAGLTARGVLYGAFALVRQLAIDPRRDSMRARRARPLRSVGVERLVETSWDYSSAGRRPIFDFFANGALAGDLSRARADARRWRRWVNGLYDQQREEPRCGC